MKGFLLTIFGFFLVFLLPFSPSAQGEEGTKGSSADTVHYTAEKIDCWFGQDTTIVLTGKAKVTYGDMTLEAGKITYYPGEEELFAEGLPDTSTGKMKYTALPVLQDRQGKITATRLTYNFKTRRGRLVNARTSYQEGFYTGYRVRKVGGKTLEILRGTYTTCDLNPPHYHFWSREMKVILNDKVVAKPVVFYLRKIPVFWLPFIVFSIRKERHSGFLIPRYGSNSVDGRYVYNLGYYLALSDYWDAIVKGALRERTGWALESEIRYHLRGRFRGSITGSIDNRTTMGMRKRGWQVGFSHFQTLTPTMNLRGRGNFYSDKNFSLRNSINLYSRLNRTLRSYLSLHKQWPSSGNSIDLAISHTKNLDTNETTLYLPQVSFRKARAPILKPPKRKHTSTRWYHLIYYSFATDFSNLIKENTGNERKTQINSIFNTSTAQRVRGWLHLQPAISWRINGSQIQGERFQYHVNYNANLSANTTLYGLFQPYWGTLRAVRHVIKPSISFSYSARSDVLEGILHNLWKVKTSQTRIAMNLSNILQAKLGKDKKQRKINLVTWNFSTAYNPEARGKKFSDLITDLRLSPGRGFEAVFNSVHSFYNPAGKFHLLAPHLKRTDFTASLRVRAKGKAGAISAESIPSEVREEVAGYASSRVKKTERLSFSRDIPYRVDISYRYSLTKTQGTLTPGIQWIKADLGVSPSPKWQISWWLNYDLQKGRITAQQVSVYRDLHCWEARLVWMPTGYRRGYYFRLNIKALPEIKIEKKRGLMGF